MSAFITTSASAKRIDTDAIFWERLWRTSGIQSVGLIVLASLIYGYHPGVGASADSLAAFYGGNRTRILIATIFSGFAVLNLMWFAAMLRTALADVGQDGWGAAATAASAAVGGLFVLLAAINSALAYSIAGSGNGAFTSGLNDLGWALVVLTSFPRAMLIMAGSFGLWRAKIISNRLFALCVLAVVLVLAGGTTWLNDGFWTPDGTYSRLVSPVIGLVWILIAGWVILKRRPATHGAW